MLQLKKLSMDFIFLERIVITPSVEVDDVTGSNMFSPAQCRKPDSVLFGAHALGVGADRIQWGNLPTAVRLIRVERLGEGAGARNIRPSMPPPVDCRPGSLAKRAHEGQAPQTRSLSRQNQIQIGQRTPIFQSPHSNSVRLKRGAAMRFRQSRRRRAHGPRCTSTSFLGRSVNSLARQALLRVEIVQFQGPWACTKPARKSCPI